MTFAYIDSVEWLSDFRRLLVVVFLAIKSANDKSVADLSERITDDICAEFGGQKLYMPVASVFVEAEKSFSGKERRKIEGGKSAENLRMRSEVVLGVVAEAKMNCGEA
jgi:hypothetical protein